MWVEIRGQKDLGIECFLEPKECLKGDLKNEVWGNSVPDSGEKMWKDPKANESKEVNGKKNEI